MKYVLNQINSEGGSFMKDKTIVCSSCGTEFTFTVGEQEFYAERGFSEPKKCKACREQAKANRNARNEKRD